MQQITESYMEQSFLDSPAWSSVCKDHVKVAAEYTVDMKFLGKGSKTIQKSIGAVFCIKCPYRLHQAVGGSCFGFKSKKTALEVPE